ncbi:PfkB family carbohydrate kinase [Salinarimonas rosea]|uniref:PfkB family carbohydrate kinase n=1 Tax=Salinarimonas rosea TaxID=552063 RepID=UPI000693AB00|nr:PfkB family carbohydrate kinase [Salinarimonas rosea]
MPPAPPRRILCLGGAAVDRTYRVRDAVRLGTSNPATAGVSHGGVARNVAETLARLGAPVALATVVGADAAGAEIVSALAERGVDVSGIERADGMRTAEYVAVLAPDGALHVGLAAMEGLARLDAGFVGRAEPALDLAGLVFADANCAADALAALVERARGAPWRLALDAVSVAKSARLPRDLHGVAVLFCARDEAEAIVGAVCPPEDLACALVARGAAAAVVTLGADGLVHAEAHGATHRPAPAADVVDVTGAGDALIAGTLHRLAAGAIPSDALAAGQALARLTIARPGAVRADLSPALLAEALADGAAP